MLALYLGALVPSPLLHDHSSRPSYLSLLRQISPSPTVFNSDLISIRSTNYNRTIQSVAGFISSLLPGVSNIPISYYLNHKDEMMLGSLKHLVVHDIDEEPQGFWSNVLAKPTQQSNCPRGSTLLKQMQSEVCDSLKLYPHSYSARDMPQSIKRPFNYSPTSLERNTLRRCVTTSLRQLLTSASFNQRNLSLNLQTYSCLSIVMTNLFHAIHKGNVSLKNSFEL
jgi:hypothetical protein